jgi:hypothetical protein
MTKSRGEGQNKMQATAPSKRGRGQKRPKSRLPNKDFKAGYMRALEDLASHKKK